MGNKIIQFLHPGGEHNQSSGIDWNTNEHKRKYLKICGRNLSKIDKKPNINELYFWGEWEAPSKYIGNIGNISNNNQEFPQHIFEPYYNLPNHEGALNTDPFVFGNQFYYCICKQGHYPSLRNQLTKGDIILFGSCIKKKEFVLDTLFVVKEHIDYNIDQIEKKRNNVNNTFYDVSLSPLNPPQIVQCKNIKCNKDGSCIPTEGDNNDDNKPTQGINQYRIYLAAMYEDRNRFEGMFSYAPCIAGKNGNIGFARPSINLNNIITNNLTQGIKISEVCNIQEIWHNITNQVLDKNLDQLLETKLPENII